MDRFRTRKSARAKLPVALAAGALAVAFMSPRGAIRVAAIPYTTTAAPKTSPSATPTPSSMLPFDSSLIFVLDNPISSSHSKTNDVVHVHLKNTLVIDGRAVIPAGAPAKLRILHAEAAQAPDIYGYVDIFFMPLQMPDGRELPLRAPTGHLTVNVTGGHESTVGLEDTIGDIFIPGHVLYHAFRKGRNFELGVGSEIRARTQATVTLDRRGLAVIATPQPLTNDTEMPHATFVAAPLATPIAPRRDRGGNTATPTPSPSPQPSPSPTASP